MRPEATLVAFIVAAVTVATAYGATEARGTRGDPHRVRTMVTIPDSKGWRLRVDGSIPNATSMVLAKNQFNSRPKPGRQFFVIRITMKYTGNGTSTAFEGVTLKAVGRSNVAYDYQDDCGVVPDEFDDFKKVFPGGVIRGNICFSVKKTDVRSLLLFAEPFLSFDEKLIFFRVR